MLPFEFLGIWYRCLSMKLENKGIVQTGKIVAIKKIHLGNAKEVRSLFHQCSTWMISAHWQPAFATFVS